MVAPRSLAEVKLGNKQSPRLYLGSGIMVSRPTRIEKHFVKDIVSGHLLDQETKSSRSFCRMKLSASATISEYSLGRQHTV